MIFGVILGGVYIYGKIGAAKLQHAQTFATILEASKVADNIQAMALPTNSRVNITVLPVRQTMLQTAIPNVPELPTVQAAALELPTANFFDYVPANPFKQGELFLTLGVGTNSKIITRPITSLTHFLPAGKTNSGKSTFLRSLAAQTLIGELDQPGRAKIALIDLTGITFNADLFGGLPQTYGGEVVTTAESAIGLINSLLQECERRARLYSQAPGLPESLPEYNAVVPTHLQLPVILTFIEEMSALSEFAGKSFLSPLKRLIWQARKYGIYLANCGQDFRASVIDKSITDMSSSRFLFGGVDDTTARVIGFNPKEHKVSIDQPGRGLVMLNKQVQEFQGLFLPKSDFVGLVNQLRIRNGLNEVGKRPETVKGYSNEGMPQKAANFAENSQSVEAEYRVLPPAPNKLEQAARAWKAGYNSVRKLAAALGVSEWQARRLIDDLRVNGMI